MSTAPAARRNAWILGEWLAVSQASAVSEGKEFGVGLASAILIAGSMVCVPLPAVMLLMGGRTWWLPRRLERVLPRISVEGEPEPQPV
jgi:uncharacterized membrane protein YdfJ with MMPL/SSD domain